ncbi:Clp [Macleaya cordata]|uniref:Clp n=1 Tax=Macleaya cordata TaxID=56857 RepID=A0A200QAP8_MACCD|nr:Clp [Macleaya cordata]
MRAGAFTLQQTLTSEAASVLKHSLGLAKRRGHAQITPLHVAATLLSSRSSLLRRACLKSHPHSTSHPLQCRALELCFNVALNRLPTTPGPLLHGQPSLSNALIAALKRAQAHQRRGCIEQQQQQPLLAIKVELEQLIISILDDPSVSRVMREAGFSSTSVKNNLEDSSSSPSSVFQCYSNSTGFQPPLTETHRDIINHNSFWQTHFLNCSSDQNPLLFSTPKKHLSTTVTHFTDSASEREQDLRLVLEVLLRKNKRRNTVVVGDCLATTEGLVAELMGRVERGEVPDELRSAHFIKFQFSSASLRFMKRDEVEMKVAELRSKVGSFASGGGAIIYVGDLKWAVENESGGFSSVGDQISGYSPAEHLVAEIGRLISDFSSSNSKVWLMATANYQTYMKCQIKQPPLEIQWALQAVSVPSGGLGLSLHGSSGLHSRMNISQNPPYQMLETKPFAAMEDPDKLTCCAECTSNFERDAGFFISGQQKPSFFLSSSNIKEMDKGSTHLPYWLQPQRPDSHHKDDLVELRRKWNRLCHSLHHPRPNHIKSSSSLFNNCASSYPWWTSTGSNLNQNITYPDSNSISFTESTSKPNQNSNSVAQFGTRQPCSIDFGFGTDGTPKQNPSEPRLDSLRNTENKELKITLALGNSMFSDQKKETAKEQQDLCKLLQENVPWQTKTVLSIAEALLSPRSTKKNGNWLMIQGTDLIGKKRLACAISETFSGSSYHLVKMNMRRENEANPNCRNIMEALKTHEKCVILIEEIDFADAQFAKFLTDGFQNSRFEDHNGRGISLAGATFVIISSTTGQEDSIVSMKLLVEDQTSPNLGQTDSNPKRKAESDLSNKRKNQRTSGKEDEKGVTTKVFSRQSSSNTLDLNVLAEEEEEDGNEEKTGEFTPVPSDLTQETVVDCKKPHELFESIGNLFILDRNSAFSDEMTGNFMSKIKRVFEEVFGYEKRGVFSVDQEVLEEMVFGSGSFLASLFEKWLKDVFQTSLLTVKKGGNLGTVRLSSFGGKRYSVLEVGYMGSNLPTNIQVEFKDCE